MFKYYFQSIKEFGIKGCNVGAAVLIFTRLFKLKLMEKIKYKRKWENSSAYSAGLLKKTPVATFVSK